MFCKTHNVRPRSRQFVEARVLRLLWDTCCLHAEARVHRVATRGAAEAGSQGRDLEVTRSRPNCHLNTPQTRRRCLHTSSIKAHLPPCSPVVVPSATKLATGGINLRNDRQIRFLATPTDNMKPAERLGCRTRSRAFIEARVLRLLWDTCCHHAEAHVHPVAATPSVRAGSQGRDLEVTRSRPNCHLNTPQTRRRCLHTSSIKAHLPPCSPVVVPSATKLATGGINLRNDRQIRFLATPTDNMKPAERLGCRTRSRAFIEARVLRLLWDTCCHHAEARVHRVAASPSVRADLDGRDLESPRSPPNRRPIKPPLLRFLLLACLIKARVPRVSSGLPVQPPSVQPPEAELV